MSHEAEESRAPIGSSTEKDSLTGADFLAWFLLLAWTLIGAYFRFDQLALKPLHHDEGVNGWFILRILDEHIYKYNPKNYHGPLLYFFNTLSVLISQLFTGRRTVEALRFAPALFGTLAIPAVSLFRRQLGWPGVLIAAAYIAVAPVEVYFSRTAIHEIYNFVFNLTFVGGVAAWAAWGRRRHIVLAGASLAALFATKETTIITVAAVIPALLLALFFGRGDAMLGVTPPSLNSPWGTRAKEVARFIQAVLRLHRRALIAAGIAFFIVWVLLFSSLFTYPRGLGAFFEAFFRWGETGVKGRGHEKAWSYFFTHLLWPYYRPLLIVGIPGLIWSTIRRDRLAIFCLVWFGLALAAYSTVPYKTPWCVLSFSGPLFLGVGLFVRESVDVMANAVSHMRRVVALGLLLIPLLLLIPYGFPVLGDLRARLMPPPTRGSDLHAAADSIPRFIGRIFIPSRDSWTINFKEYDVKGHPFIYVQNVREYLDLINDIHGLIDAAQLEGDKKKPRILMIDAKNPMRWYLQKTGTQTWRKELNDKVKKMLPNDVDIVVVSSKKSREVQKLLGKGFLKRRYHERPGRKIDMFIRRSLWEKYVKIAREGMALKPSKKFSRLSYSARTTAKMTEPWSKRPHN